MLEQDRQTIEQMTAEWDDPTAVDWGADDMDETERDMQMDKTPSAPLLKCTALYSYTVSDKFSIVIYILIK